MPETHYSGHSSWRRHIWRGRGREGDCGKQTFRY